MIKVVDGDITKTDKDIIVQQVNCLGVMGAGLANTIAQRYPNVAKEYRKFWSMLLKNGVNDDLLGLVNYVDVYDGKIIANVFGQLDIKKNRYDTTVYTDTVALLKGITNVKLLAEQNGFSVAIPTYIGCGLAGGNWQEIREGIESIFQDSNVDVVFYHYR